MRVVLLLVLLGIGFGAVQAQTNLRAVETVDDLKLQLIDITAKQEAVKLGIQQLDESLKPENIERSLAGIGSTRPEELREQRRRQLLIEKMGLAAELEVLNLKRTKLEEAISTAEVRAYQQSASGSPIDNSLRSGLAQSSWLFAMLLVAAVTMATGVVALFGFVRVLNA